MGKKIKYDFGGYATKNNLKCSDGRTIKQDAFKHNDQSFVPLVWQHLRHSPDNILGKVLLENRPDGMYAYGLFNETEAGQNAKALVQHGDITNLSIFASELKEVGTAVMHGSIKEVSLVLAGANPGATIDNLTIEHGDSFSESETEARIWMGDNDTQLTTENVEHSEDAAPASMDNEVSSESASNDKTVEDVLSSMTEEQQNLVYALLGRMQVAEPINHTLLEEGDLTMKKNVFEKKDPVAKATLTHDQMTTIMAEAVTCGSFKQAVLAHAQEYGIQDIEKLFPDAQSLNNEPEMIARRMGWVQGVINDTHKSPFSRVRSTAADVTAEEARARGYVTGARKKEEVIKALKRITTPTTVYKKQKLDNDDILDITEFNVVIWLKREMRLLLMEEIARAYLIGDGREADSEDKINEENIRPIYKDDPLYVHRVITAAGISPEDKIEAIIRARKYYKGSGSPKYYTTNEELTDMLLVRDKVGRRLYNTEAELTSALRVSEIVEVDVMENTSRIGSEELDGKDSVYIDEKINLCGLLGNLFDYNVGADRGGEVSMFEDFDIDYNQHKYLIETRLSGAIKKPKSFLVIEQLDGPAEEPEIPEG